MGPKNSVKRSAVDSTCRLHTLAMGQVISDVNSCFISPEQLPDGVYGLVQLFFLFSVYGYVLFWAAEEIAEGSELLLLLPKIAGVVGSVVLPVLGAVPDGAIV